MTLSLNLAKQISWGSTEYLDTSVTWNAEFVDLNDSTIRHQLDKLDPKYSLYFIL